MISETYPTRYCRDPIDKINGYDEAISSSEEYVCHHVLELTIDGQFAHTPSELKRLGMYWNRPAYELMFIKRSEHQIMHMNARPPMKWRSLVPWNKGIKTNKPAWNKGIPCSDESKRKQSETKRKLHRVPWNKGIPMTDDAKAKLSKSQKARLAYK